VFEPLFIVVALAALGFLIVVHEGGHYFVASWCKMRIERFSIGFGPGILKKQSKRTGTTFQLAPIPFGGFVEIRGMNIAEEVDPDDKFAYPNRPVWQRFVTIFAGPATNYLSALVLAMALYTCHGIDIPQWIGVGAVMDGYDAHGKLESGDRIVAVNKVPLLFDSPKGLVERVNAAKGEPLTLTLERNGATRSETIKPRLDNEATTRARHHLDEIAKLAPALAPFASTVGKMMPEPVWRIGVKQEVQYRTESIGVVDATARALRYPVEQTKVIGVNLYSIVFGDEKADPGGPIRIVEEFYHAFVAGVVPGIRLLMLLSVYLGLFNLLPLPALDGGRLVFLVYEMVTRRRANPKIESMVHMAGIMALGVVMLVVLYIDVRRFWT
jgi:regulator of sigma E protease